MARTATVLLLVFSCGCSARVRDGSDADFSAETTSSKEIVGKRAPNRLIANDGSTCTVSPSAYTATRVGDYAACPWSR